jgi:predicted MPP superfamily phosphohydrolase
VFLAAQSALLLAAMTAGAVFERQAWDYRLTSAYYYLFALVALLYLPKILFALALIPETMISAKRKKRRRQQYFPYKPMRHVRARLGLLAGAALDVLLLWGIFFGRFDCTVTQVKIAFPALPEKFNGFRIVQISDLHAGSSFGFERRWQKTVEAINRQQADVIVFTGDFVNNFAEELAPLAPLFARLEAPAGKYAICGNHDYGGYADWRSPADRQANQEALERNIALMGFDLLKNRSVVIERDSANRIALSGTENWGGRERDPRRANLPATLAAARDAPFRILLTHDPSYWDFRVKDREDIALTLSGHIHGMQAGVKIDGRRYSPAQLFYRYGFGLYGAGGRYLYVNSGLGVIGFPGRVGMPPEITVIELTTGGVSR